jgi:hypothetical protein
MEAYHQGKGWEILGVPDRTFRYWVSQISKGKSQTNKAIRESMSLRQPSYRDDQPIVEYDIDTSRILLIPDIHAPYHHPKTLSFLKRIRDKYKPTLIINMGDETDGHAISFHDSDPDLQSAGRELECARKFITSLHSIFPQMMICHSNHGSLIFRRAKAHGIPAAMVKTYREILFPNTGGEQWSWHEEIRLRLPNGEDLVCMHEAGGNLLSAAAHEHASLAIGHLHGKFGVQYATNSSGKSYFAVNTGCLIDSKSMAFAYGKNFKLKPTLGCVIIEDSIPNLIPMGS